MSKSTLFTFLECPVCVSCYYIIIFIPPFRLLFKFELLVFQVGLLLAVLFFSLHLQMELTPVWTLIPKISGKTDGGFHLREYAPGLVIPQAYRDNELQLDGRIATGVTEYIVSPFGPSRCFSLDKNSIKQVQPFVPGPTFMVDIEKCKDKDAAKKCIE